MLSLPAMIRIFVCTQPTDLRKSFDSLAALVEAALGQDPLSGHLFLFGNRRRDRVKILYWDRDGLALWYKRLEEGTFQLPYVRPEEESDASRAGGSHASWEIRADELALLLGGIDLASVKRRKRYQRPTRAAG